jgi:hypothetical protein
MFVLSPLRLPVFGAIEMKLRYDAPISVRDAMSGQLSSMDYKTAWDSKLNDVVVALPNGSRFVFWRGSSYIPFWAGLHNTGFSYEWAETTPPPDGFVDSVEPLMDKELRYGRVEIVESTASRVHVRWTYQSTDFTYKVWGDSAAEDFYFYPDGFGTRTLTLKSAPGADYELSEFIVLTPQSAYPLEVLPKNLAELIYLDGFKEEISFPCPAKSGAGDNFFANRIENSRKIPIVYRLRTHKDDTHRHLLLPWGFDHADCILCLFRSGLLGHTGVRGQPLASGSGNLHGKDDRRPNLFQSGTQQPSHMGNGESPNTYQHDTPGYHRYPWPLEDHDDSKLVMAYRYDRCIRPEAYRMGSEFQPAAFGEVDRCPPGIQRLCAGASSDSHRSGTASSDCYAATPLAMR